MSAPHVERALARSLQEHAEDAMSKTDTQAELQRFQAGAEHRAKHDRRRWAIGGAALAAGAAAAAFAVGSLDGGDDSSAPGPADNPPSQTAEERVAQQLVDAFTAGDARRTVALLPPADGLRADWTSEIRRDQAWSREYFVQPCRELGVVPDGTEVTCLFDYHLWHSEQMGLGPFENNAFRVVVQDGEVVSADVTSGFSGNGQSDLFEQIGTWVRQNHPGDWAFLASSEGLTPTELDRWYRMWKQYSQEYADQRTAAGAS